MLFIKRAVAFYINIFVSAIIGMLSIIPLCSITHERAGKFIGIYMAVAIVAFLLIDIKGRSPGKMLMQLIIVSTKNNDKIPIWKYIVRNLTMCIWPVELIIILRSKDMCRLTDKKLGLAVQEKNKSNA